MNKEYLTEFIPISVIGFQMYEVPTPVMLSLLNETNNMISNDFEDLIPYNTNLAGNLEREFTITESLPLLNEYIKATAPIYWRSLGREDEAAKQHTIRYTDENLPDLWVNFQKKTEFNPIHNHSGDLSFVIYLKCPYTLEDENKNESSRNSNFPVAGTLQFIFPDMHSKGSIGSHTVPTDTNFEGRMIMFSSKLQHVVYPFYTSDEYRITVAGNITIT